MRRVFHKLAYSAFLIGASIAICFAGWHSFVMTEDGLRTYPANGFKLPPVYLNLRDAGLSEVAQHPDLALQIILSGDARYLPGENAREWVEERIDSFSEGLQTFFEGSPESNSPPP